jgi:hypothetical protein
MRVGIDFDNTIANYEQIFVAAAQARGWITRGFRGSKRELRDAVRLLTDGETKWQLLQAEVYGARMAQAVPFKGVIEFVHAARRSGIELCVVSHKTRFAAHDRHGIDLREAALRWLEVQGFLDPGGHGLSRHWVFFEDTRADKIARIAASGCTIFVDDLAEVLVDPAFPSRVERILFSTSGEPAPLGDVAICRSWDEIGRRLLDRPVRVVQAPRGCPELAAVAERLVGDAVCAIAPARPGGNNRLYRVETRRGDVFALKAYPRQEGDPRDRLGTELKALSFMRRHGIDQIPGVVAADSQDGYALYEWIEGEPPAADANSLSAVLVFVRALERLSSAEGAALLPLASEACLSAAEIVTQVDRRATALSAIAEDHPELSAFLRGDFRRARERVVTAAREDYTRVGLGFDSPIDPARRRLSPSDFGFHNALVRPDGTVVFLDFEYFGWDDPAKLCCDFVLHPGMDLTDELQQRFLRGVNDIFAADPALPHRLAACMPLYGLRWTMILLNEFLPERWQRRLAAGLSGNRPQVLRRQLAKAKTMLARVTFADAGVAP